MAEQQRTRTIAPLFTWRSAIAESDLKPVVRHVLLALSLYMNEMGGSAYPGSTRLARNTGLHLETVKESLREAVKLGWIRVEHQGGSPQGGKRLASEYSACVPGGNPVDIYRKSTTTGSPQSSDRKSSVVLPEAHDFPISSVITSENSRGFAPKNCVRCHGEGSFWDGQKQRICDQHTFNDEPSAPPPADLRAWLR